MRKSTVSDIEITPGLHGQEAPARLPRGQDKQTLANTLRGKGWSYRRIAEALEVQYGIVSRWLSGPVVPPTPEPMPRYVSRPVVVPLRRDAGAGTGTDAGWDDNALAMLGRQHGEMIERCDRLLAALEAERAESRAREGKLLGVIERLEKLVEDVARRSGM